MLRTIELSEGTSLAVTPSVGSPQGRDGAGATGPSVAAARSTFLVKLRSIETRSWGNQTEIAATSERDAAEQLTGERLLDLGDRAELRARVSRTPSGSHPDVLFYRDVPKDVP
jgi:hypothetical protein